MRFQGTGTYVATPDLIPGIRQALLKNEQDVHLFERLVAMSRHNR